MENTSEIEKMLQEMVNRLARKIAAEMPEMPDKQVGEVARKMVLDMAQFAADIATEKVA